MLLKTVTTLIFAVLVAPSTAFVVNDRLRNHNELPRISFTKNNDELRLRSTASKFSFFERLQSQSDWSYISGNDSYTIVQQMAFPLLWATYEVTAKANGLSANGHVPVTFTKMNFTFSITATGDENDCYLNVKTTSPNSSEGLVVTFTGLDEVRKAFEEPAVFEEFKGYIWGLLANAVPYKLKTLIPSYLETIMDLDKLCTDLLKSTPEHYPQPYFTDLRF